MEQNRGFSTDEAREIGERDRNRLGSSRFDVEQFRMGLGVELEHGRQDPSTNVTDDDELTTGKIARAHLNEFPDYYTRLAEMEAEAERYWADRESGPARVDAANGDFVVALVNRVAKNAAADPRTHDLSTLL